MYLFMYLCIYCLFSWSISIFFWRLQDKISRGPKLAKTTAVLWHSYVGAQSFAKSFANCHDVLPVNLPRKNSYVQMSPELPELVFFVECPKVASLLGKTCVEKKHNHGFRGNNKLRQTHIMSFSMLKPPGFHWKISPFFHWEKKGSP